LQNSSAHDVGNGAIAAVSVCAEKRPMTGMLCKRSQSQNIGICRREPAAQAMLWLDPGCSRCCKIKFESAEGGVTKSDSKSVVYEFRTKSAKSGGLEKNRRREGILGLGQCLTVGRFRREGQCLLGISVRSNASRECSTRTDWRRERNWEPTLSEFVER
jgi:hypothetical protein